MSRVITKMWNTLRSHWDVRLTTTDWPIARATVQLAYVKPVEDGPGYIVTLSYSYFVEEYRSGEFSTGTFPNEDRAHDFKRFVSGREITVRYHPNNPDESVLDEPLLMSNTNQDMVDAKSDAPFAAKLALDRAEYTSHK